MANVLSKSTSMNEALNANELSKESSTANSSTVNALRAIESTTEQVTSKTPLSVAEAKQQLRHNAANIDYLAPIKENPIQSVGFSFFAGLLAGGDKSSSLASSKVTTLVAKSLIQL